MSASIKQPILGVLLANSPACKSQHTERCMKRLMGKPVLTHIIEHTSPQVTQLILNANGDPTRFHNINIPIVPDAIDNHHGALAGILTGMEWAIKHMPECEWVASFATSAPLIPDNMVQLLFDGIQQHDADMAYISCNGKAHPEYGLWPIELAEDLRYALEEDDIKRVDKWCSLYKSYTCAYTASIVDPFTSANLIEGIMALQKNEQGIDSNSAETILTC